MGSTGATPAMAKQDFMSDRFELSMKLGSIPSRSDVVRYALEQYLGVDLTESESDGRKSSGAKRK